MPTLTCPSRDELLAYAAGRLPDETSEQIANSRAADIRADIYSLGCTLYKLLTGRAPFDDAEHPGPAEKMAAHAGEMVPAICQVNLDVPTELAAVLDRMLAKSPAARFADPVEVAEALLPFTPGADLAGLLARATSPEPSSVVPITLRRYASSSRRSVMSTVMSTVIRFKGVLAMIAALGIGLLGMFMLSATPPDIAGQWSGEEWGQVVLKKTGDTEYTGTYSATAGKPRGEIQLQWSRVERRFNGTWREGEDRFGELSVRRVGDEIRGALTTDPKSKINPATPRLADLTWSRAPATTTVHNAQPGAVASPAPKPAETLPTSSRSLNEPKGPLAAKIRQVLNSTAQMEFVETPATDVVDYLTDLHKLPFKVSEKAGKTEVTVNLKDVTLGAALQAIEDKYPSLQFVVRDYGILLTEREVAKQQGWCSAVEFARSAAGDGQDAPAVERRTIDKPVGKFPAALDLSTPETACAAWQRASARKDARAIVDLSWIRVDVKEVEQWYREGERRGPQDMAIYLQAVAESKIVEVATYRGDLASVVTFLPFPAGKGAAPYSTRAFGRIDGKWKNMGEDRVRDLAAARADFDRKKEILWQQFQGLIFQTKPK